MPYEGFDHSGEIFCMLQYKNVASMIMINNSKRNNGRKAH